MAFVNRSERRTQIGLLSPTKIGPGEYTNNKIKEDARTLHKLRYIYTHRKKSKQPKIIIAFNSTGERESALFRANTNPGPGAYLDISPEKNTNHKLPLLTTKDELIFVEENEKLVPKIKNENKGFLSSEKRFFEKININNNRNPEYSYNNFNRRSTANNINNKNHNSRYGKIKFSFDKSMPNNISLLDNHSKPTIPDKKRGEFKMVNGNIEEIKKNYSSTEKDENVVGPGKYDVFPNWNTRIINWNYGYNKISKNTIFKNEMLSSFKEHKNIDKINISVKMSNRKLRQNISIEDISNLSNKDNTKYLNNRNNSMRNQVFNRHIKDRKKILAEQMNKRKQYNEIMNQIQYKESPGPGFYGNKMHHPMIFNTNKTQNFGSNTPKFSHIEDEIVDVGPGSYFLEKNKYQPKIEIPVHVKKPEKKIIVHNSEGLYVNNNRLKNRYKYPGPGQYNIIGNFIKDEVSNVKSFGILAERFNYNNLPKNNDDIYDYKTQRHLYDKKNFEYDDEMQNKINKKLLELKEQEEAYQKKKRDKFMNKKSPGVGDYSPEFSTSISYNVKSKLNPYRNKVAPFNVMNSRFGKENKMFSFKKGIPGPGDYDVAKSFDALINGKKNGYLYNPDSNENNSKNKKDREESETTPGPGLYNQNLTSSWSKKSFNVLFMDK